MNELDWLTAERPEVPGPDEETTARARAALLTHAAGEPPAWVRGDDAAWVHDAAPVGPARGRVTAGAGPARDRARRRARSPRPGRASRGPRKAPLYSLAAAVFAVAIVVAAGALPSGDGSAPPIVGGPAPAEAALVKLSERIQAAPTPTGDATLVLRSHHFPDAKDFTGADLYFDDGRYYYGITLAELKQNTNDIGDGVPKLERDAAKAAVTLPPDRARRKMIDATFGAQGEPAAGSPPARAAEAARKQKLAHLTGPTPTPAPKRMIDDNRVWIGAMDALIAGAGDPDVRAGVMELLSTIGAVAVQDHGATLDIRNTDFPDGYAETLTVDAKTGVIEKMVGGTVGKTPSVTVTYDIKRVTASDVLAK
jgi:hypothetical protein